MNINKLVPRLTISAKLSIAFAVLTMLPLAVVAAVVAPMAVGQLRRNAAGDLENELELVRVRVAGSIREAKQHLAFVLDVAIGPLLRDFSPEGATEAQNMAATFLRSDSSAILGVKAFNSAGRVVFDVTQSRDLLSDRDSGGGSGFYYLWMAENGPGEEPLLIPVELRGPSRSSGELRVIPAIAIVQTVRDDEGNLLGVAVAEASASGLFSALDASRSDWGGVRGLVDSEGRFLYHSERKQDWASLLPATADVSLHTDFEPQLAAEILSGNAATLRTAGREIVSFTPVARAGADGSSLVLYRTVPLRAIDASVRDFLVTAGGVSVGILAIVMVLAVVAARQLTKPIYQLQRAARDLAHGGETGALRIETNDELEDLAHDFSAMAEALTENRRMLETTVEARTRDLEVTRAELSEIVTHAADAIIGLDNDGRIRFWNEGAQNLFDYGEEEATGQFIDNLIGGKGTTSAHESAYIKHALDTVGSVTNLRTSRRGKHGSPFPVSLTQTSITDHDGDVVGSSLIIRDNRLQSRVEEQMRRSERLAAASIMAAGLAHELNNPLAVLGNRIELMQREAAKHSASETIQKDLGVLGEHVERLRGITTDLLSFARDGDDEQQAINTSALLQRIVRLFERTFVTKGLDLTTNIQERVAPIMGSEKAIETVFVNLLLNALQATPAGGSVAVGVVGDSDFVSVDVRDSGPGIPLDTRRRIFEPFFTTKGGKGGTGLGLTVCLTIVERHLGKIWVDDAEGGGSRFVVRFPVLRDAP